MENPDSVIISVELSVAYTRGITQYLVIQKLMKMRVFEN